MSDSFRKLGTFNVKIQIAPDSTVMIDRSTLPFEWGPHDIHHPADHYLPVELVPGIQGEPRLPGQIYYVAPWAVFVDSNGKYWIDQSFSHFEKPMGTAEAATMLFEDYVAVVSMTLGDHTPSQRDPDESSLPVLFVPSLDL